MYDITIKRGESGVVHVPWPALEGSPRPIELKPISRWCVVSSAEGQEVMTIAPGSGLSIGAVEGKIGVFVEFDTSIFPTFTDDFVWTLNVQADDVSPDCDAQGSVTLVAEYSKKAKKPARPWDFFKPGVHHATEKQQAERMAICNACDELSMAKTCGICHCFMPMKTRLAHAECPIGKWVAISHEKPVKFYGAAGDEKAS
jgi:hypothetical protein